MKLSTLNGKSVISAADAQKVGTVDDALVDSPQGKIMALKVKPTQAGAEQAVAADHIKAFGEDVVVIDNPSSLQTFDSTTGMGTFKSLKSMVGCRVITDSGHVLGTIYEVEVDPESHQITDYLYDGGPLGELLGHRHALSPKDVISSGPDLVTVTSAATPPSKAA